MGGCVIVLCWRCALGRGKFSPGLGVCRQRLLLSHHSPSVPPPPPVKLLLSLPLCSARLCPSYPQQLLVPAWITDKELENVAAFRSWKRFPAVVYRLVGFFYRHIAIKSCLMCFFLFGKGINQINHLQIMYSNLCVSAPADRVYFGLENCNINS